VSHASLAAQPPAGTAGPECVRGPARRRSPGDGTPGGLGVWSGALASERPLPSRSARGAGSGASGPPTDPPNRPRSRSWLGRSKVSGGVDLASKRHIIGRASRDQGESGLGHRRGPVGRNWHRSGHRSDSEGACASFDRSQPDFGSVGAAPGSEREPGGAACPDL
jgi:hypothetical protein